MEEEEEEGSGEDEDGHSDLESEQESENEENNEEEEASSSRQQQTLSREELKAQQEAAKAELPYTFTGDCSHSTRDHFQLQMYMGKSRPSSRFLLLQKSLKISFFF